MPEEPVSPKPTDVSTTPVIPSSDSLSNPNVTIPKKNIEKLLWVLLIVAIVMVVGGILGWMLGQTK